MNLGLHITKNPNIKKHSKVRRLGFAVTDLNKSKEYPANFLCILPKVIDLTASQQSVFSELYGKESKKIARRLLTKALDGEADLEIRNEIRKRLKILAPRITVKTRCQYCGQIFEQKTRKVRKHKLCQKCYQERMQNITNFII